MLRVRMLVKGVVQGVGFRSFVKKNADTLGIVGLVRNVAEGVEIVAEGDNNLLRHFISKIKEGPSLSRVEDTEINFEDPLNEFEEFSVQ